MDPLSPCQRSGAAYVFCSFPWWLWVTQWVGGGGGEVFQRHHCGAERASSDCNIWKPGDSSAPKERERAVSCRSCSPTLVRLASLGVCVMRSCAVLQTVNAKGSKGLLPTGALLLLAAGLGRCHPPGGAASPPQAALPAGSKAACRAASAEEAHLGVCG